MTANGAGVAVLLAALAAAAPALAHGFGDRYILPVPLSLWMAGAAVVVGLSFVIIEARGQGGTAAGRYPDSTCCAGRRVGSSSIGDCGSPVASSRSPCSR